MRKNVFIYIIIFLLALAITTVYIVKNNKDSGKEIIISKESTKDYILEKHKDGFVTYNGTELIRYNSDMEQKWVIALDEDEAELYVNEDYILLFNSESDRLFLIKDGEVVSKIEPEKKLRVASANKNGYVSALTSDKGYRGQVIVYNEKGKELAEYSFGDKYILGAYLMDDNHTLILNVIEDSIDGYVGKVLYSELKSGEIKKEILSNSIFSYINVYKNKIYLSEDDGFYCYDKNGKQKWSYAYDSSAPLYIGFSEGYISMALKTSEGFRGSKVLNFNLSGRIKGSYETESYVKGFDADGGFTAVIVNENVLMLNKRGKIVSTMELNGEINDIKLFKDSGKIMLLSDKAIMKKISR